MRSTLIPSLVILAFLFCSCSKEHEQEIVPGGESTGIDAVMTTSPMQWIISDNVKMRWDGVSYQSAQTCESLQKEEGGYCGKISEYHSGKELFVFAASDGDFVNKNSVAFRTEIPSVQSGRIENTLFYSAIHTSKILTKQSGDKVTSIEFNADLSPFFAVLKMTIPKSFGFTQLRVQAESAIAGTVQLCPDKTWGTIGSSGFMYRPTGTHMNQNTTVTVSDNGNVLADEVYVVLLPDAYDSQAAEYYCSTQSLKFILKGEAGEFSFEKSIEDRIYRSELYDPGSIISIDVALKVQDCLRTPAVVLDSALVANSIMQGAEYYFVTGTAGFDDMPDPTDTDSRLTSAGITVPVQNKSDRLYVKVLGRSEGCEDVYLKALVRNWKFDVNYIAPQELVSEYDGLKLSLGSNFSNELCTDARIGYLGVTKGKAEIVPELSGSGWLNANFFSGSFGTTFWMYQNGKQLYRIDMPEKTYYSDNDIIKSVSLSTLDRSDALSCEWSYRLWLRNMILLEQTVYTPEQHEGDISIEDFEGNINYN
jgi:hypothetical protein